MQRVQELQCYIALVVRWLIDSSNYINVFLYLVKGVKSWQVIVQVFLCVCLKLCPMDVLRKGFNTLLYVSLCTYWGCSVVVWSLKALCIKKV